MKAFTMKAPRGVCPVCAKDVALRRGGLIREHSAPDANKATVCPGSGWEAAGEFHRQQQFNEPLR